MADYDFDHDGSLLAGPFIGFAVGTVLFGVTILQAHQYYLRYPNDPWLTKLKVFVVCSLDCLHFVLAAKVVYTFLITNFGSVKASAKNTPSMKALTATQATVVVLVQLLYLDRIYKLSRIPAMNGWLFRLCIKVVIGLIGSVAVSVGIVFAYEAQKITAIPRLGGDLQWLIFLGYGTIASVDTLITAMMCFVLYKNRLDIGINHISRHSNRLLLNLITYALATGLVTTLTAILGLVLYIARPDTFLYVSVMFSITRLYTNSLLAMLNVRQRLNTGLVSNDLGLGYTNSDVVFRVPLSLGGGMTRGRNVFTDTSGTSRSRNLPAIRTQKDHDVSPVTKSSGVDSEDSAWQSAKGSWVSSKIQLQEYSPRTLDRRFSL